jgi:hypothetical protein
LGKTRKTFDVLLAAEFYGAHDSWTEYLCLARNPDGSITLTSRARNILAEAARYRERGWLPATIKRKEVWGFDGDYVVGQRLLPHDGGAELTVSPNQFDVAAEWLIRREWHRQQQFGEAWAPIRSALYGPEFFSPEKPLPLRPGMAADRSREEGVDRPKVDYSQKGDEGAPSQPGGSKPREIVIRCADPAKPWIIWLEVVFIEWSKTSFSVYARTGEALDGGAEFPGLMPRTPGRLSWRKVVQFVQSHDLAAVSSSDAQQIDIYGVRPWQRDIIAAAMMRLSTVVPFLSGLSDKELGSLHRRLGGFLSDESCGLLRQLAEATRSPLLAGKSLAEIAQLVGSPDPMDAGRLAKGCAAYLASRNAERVLAQYRDTAAPSTETFLSLLHRQAPRSPRIRAGLFELWIRAEPKPTGGDISGMHMDDELPILHWLLREHAAKVFRTVVENHHSELQEFVLWFLGKARNHTEHFSGNYEYHSFNVYALPPPACCMGSVGAGSARRSGGFRDVNSCRGPTPSDAQP